MKKTLRKIIASVLLVVMLFSISATAAFAIGDANVGNSSNSGSSGGKCYSAKVHFLILLYCMLFLFYFQFTSA